MRRILIASAAILGLFLPIPLAQAQQELKTNGWGSLSGKVILDGKIPEAVSFIPIMKKHNDGPACCLLGKDNEKKDTTWIVDAKTKAVANVVVWIKPPDGFYLPTNDKYKKRADKVVLDQPHCAFLPRVTAFNPIYIDNGKPVSTGQKYILKNSAVVPHNTRATGNPKYNDGFNVNIPPKGELDVSKKFNPQPLPIMINCDFHPWMAARIFVFDHPYYAITNDKGEYTIPIVPAGAEVRIMGYHEGVGWLLTRDGQALTVKAGKNTFDLTVKAP